MVFFFNDTATTEIYTLSLHDALPISARRAADLPGRHAGLRHRRAPDRPGVDPLRVGPGLHADERAAHPRLLLGGAARLHHARRSEEHTSELQSRQYLVCRLLLEKKNS